MKHRIGFILMTMLVLGGQVLAEKTRLIIRGENATDLNLHHQFMGPYFNSIKEVDEEGTQYEFLEFEAGIFTLFRPHGNNIFLYLRKGIQAEIIVNDDRVKIIESNDPQFGAFVEYQNFFNATFPYLERPVEKHYVEKMTYYFSKKAQIEQDFFDQIQTLGVEKDSFLYSLIETDFFYRKYEKIYDYYLQMDDRFHEKELGDTSKVYSFKKHVLSLNKFMKKEYPEEVPEIRDLAVDSFLKREANNLKREEIFNHKALKNEKSTKKFIRKNLGHLSNDVLELVVLRRLLELKWDDRLEFYESRYLPSIGEEKLKNIWGQHKQAVGSEREYYKDKYIDSPREQVFLEGNSAIEAYLKFKDDHLGQVILIDIWTTWCGPCIRNFPYSNKLKDEIGNEDVVFLYIVLDADSNKDKAIELIKKHNLSGYHIVIPDTKFNGENIESLFSIDGYPRYIILDRSGNVGVKYAYPPIVNDGENLKKMLMELL